MNDRATHAEEHDEEEIDMTAMAYSTGEVDVSDEPDIQVEPRLVTVTSPSTGEAVTLRESIYKRLREEENSRFKNYACQVLNYVHVVNALLCKMITTLPMAVFYLVLFSVMASNLNVSDYEALLANLIPLMPELIMISMIATMVAVMIDFFINGKKYGLRSVIRQALFERAKNNAPLQVP